MAKQNPTLYSISKTFMWFAITSIVLTGSLIAIVMTDYSREWKVWQKQFIQLKLKMAAEDLKAAASAIDKTKLAEPEKEGDEKDATPRGYLKDEKALQKQIAKGLEEKTRAERRIQKTKPTLAKDILNAPMLDFVAPTLQVKQIVLDNLYDDYHFSKVQ